MKHTILTHRVLAKHRRVLVMHMKWVQKHTHTVLSLRSEVLFPGPGESILNPPSELWPSPHHNARGKYWVTNVVTSVQFLVWLAHLLHPWVHCFLDNDPGCPFRVGALTARRQEVTTEQATRSNDSWLGGIRLLLSSIFFIRRQTDYPSSVFCSS